MDSEVEFCIILQCEIAIAIAVACLFYQSHLWLLMKPLKSISNIPNCYTSDLSTIYI